MPETRTVELGFRPWEHQREAHRRKKRFTVLVWHRRSGKTVFSIVELVLAAIQATLPKSRFAYVAPFYRQAKAVAWDYLKSYAGNVPNTVVSEQELAVTFPNGSQVRLFGADNPDALRGLYFDGVVIDEVADMRSNVFGEIIRPALADRQGWALFIGTPKGTNLFSEMYHKALKDETWYADLKRAADTGVIPDGELEQARREMSPAQFAQEFDCDFSSSADDALILFSDAVAASRRVVPEQDFAYFPRVLGVDVARYGSDRTVIARRQGWMLMPLTTLRQCDLMDVAARVAREAAEWSPKAIFIDEGGVGAGVVDRLRQLGHTVVGVNFGAKAGDPRFVNKRAEMWQKMADWVKRASLPNDSELITELTAPRFSYANKAGKFELESKDSLRERGLASPDKADAVAVTFAEDLRVDSFDARGRSNSLRPTMAVTEYTIWN